MELNTPKSIRLDDNMIEDIHVYRGSKKPPLTFSEATRELLTKALKSEKTNEHD